MLDQLLFVIAILAWAWFLMVVMLIGVRAYQAGGLSEAGRAVFSGRVLLVLTVAIGLSLLSSSLVFIEPQEAGVVISLISPNGYRDRPLRSGLHFLVPLAERVVRYPVYWQTYTMSAETLEGSKTGNDAISARTADGQSVYLDSSVIYRLDGNEVNRIHIEFQNRYVDDFIRPVMRGVIRTEVSQFTADEVNSSKRKDLETSLEDTLRERFADKGFILDTFLLRNVSFSQQYATAIESKQVAEQGRIQSEYQAEQMRNLAAGQRDKLKLEAEGKAAAVEVEAAAQAKAILLKAQAEAQGMQYINEALKKNRDLLVYQYISKLSPNVKVMLLPNDAPFLFPLPDLNTLESPSSGYTSTITTTLGITLPTILPPQINIPTVTPTPAP
jgi:regulator of protease activity HflC (stomatin/prohibitin superfamily)